MQNEACVPCIPQALFGFFMVSVDSSLAKLHSMCEAQIKL